MSLAMPSVDGRTRVLARRHHFRANEADSVDNRLRGHEAVSMNIDDDASPSAWVGHIVQKVSDPAATTNFYERIGLRTVLVRKDMGITELRGGTHIIFVEGEVTAGEDASFDLMVADLGAAHESWSAAGAEVSDIVKGDNHNTFKLSDPDGIQVTVSDSHVIGAV